MAADQARDNGSQNVQYLRARVKVTTTGLASGIKIGRLPSRAFITQVSLHEETAFDSVTSDTLQLGTTATGVDILAATSVHGAAGYIAAASAAGLGLKVTGSGEVDVYTQWVAVGGGATHGDVTIIIGFITDHDQ